MKILFLDSPAFAKKDMLEAFHNCNIETDLFMHEDYNVRKSAAYDAAFDAAVENTSYDFVFSFNYYPILATCAHRHNLRYVSYVYDSPLVALYSFTITYPTNYIFLFDYPIYEELKQGGIDRVFYLPLAANAKRLSTMQAADSILDKISSEISFVGSLYNEDHLLYDRLYQKLPAFTKGYLDAIIAAQQQVYGEFLIPGLLNDTILSDMQKSVPYAPNEGGIETPRYIYANYFLARKLAESDRTAILKKLSAAHQVKLYTNNPTPQLPKVENMGAIDYYEIMPLVFQHSKINLNITLRSIQKGIPLRAFDIMGSGGFLLTNYQEDFLNYFVPGEDFIYYSSYEEAETYADYYLSHEKERQQIAANALGKILDAHTFEHRIQTMLSVIDGQ